MSKRAENSTKSSKRGVVGRPFAKGQSGNPGGRKPIPDDVKAIFSDANTVAVAEALYKTAIDRDHSDHVRAAVAFLDRKFGKAIQPITGANGGAIPIEIQGMSNEELAVAAAAVLKAAK